MTAPSALHVAFLIPGLTDGGAQVQCLRLLEALAAQDNIALRLVYFNDGVNSGRLRSDLYDVIKLPGGSNYNPANILAAIHAIRTFHPAVIFSWLHAADVYAPFIRFATRARWLMSERDSAYPRELRYRLREKSGLRADAIACNSEAGRRYWQELGAACPIYVLPNIVSPVARTLTSDVGVGIATVGRLELQKNIAAVARAYCTVAADRPDARFAFIGEGALRGEVEAIVAAAGCRDRVTLLGFRADAAALIVGARLLVTMSHHEGTPNVLLEAIAADVPAVVSDIPEHRAVLGDDYPFLVAQREDPAAVARAITRALDNADPARDYVFARARLAEMSAPVVAARYRAVFDELAGR